VAVGGRRHLRVDPPAPVRSRRPARSRREVDRRGSQGPLPTPQSPRCPAALRRCVDGSLHARWTPDAGAEGPRAAPRPVEGVGRMSGNAGRGSQEAVCRSEAAVAHSPVESRFRRGDVPREHARDAHRSAGSGLTAKPASTQPIPHEVTNGQRWGRGKNPWEPRLCRPRTREREAALAPARSALRRHAP
jgi:hypothetical protein